VKFLEKVYLIILLAVGFIAYKSPSVIGFLLYD
jgi:ribosomal protein S13